MTDEIIARHVSERVLKEFSEYLKKLSAEGISVEQFAKRSKSVMASAEGKIARLMREQITRSYHAGRGNN